jgi:hypothetical protein
LVSHQIALLQAVVSAAAVYHRYAGTSENDFVRYGAKE